MILFVSWNRLHHLGIVMDKHKWMSFDLICKIFCQKVLKKRSIFMATLPRIDRVDINYQNE